jgi:hypothetical protein
MESGTSGRIAVIMGAPSNLFEFLPATAVLGYRNLRDPPSKNAGVCRDYCDYLWGRFFLYADEGFEQDFTTHLHQRFWEMYLGVTLLDAGHAIIAPKPGPDFGLVLDGRRIWIEAVTATPGDAGRPDSVPRFEPNETGISSGYVPQDQITLRCTAAISAKFPRQYRQHVEKGIIGERDCYIVAVNHAEAYYWAEVGTPPFMLRAVLGLGSMFVTFDRASREITKQGVLYRGSITKSTGAEVDTTLFLAPDSAPLSAVIGSVTTIGTPVHIQDAQHEMGQDFRLINNPMARNAVPDGLLVRGEIDNVSLGPTEFQVSARLLEP